METTRQLIEQLRQHQFHISTAESCTGGMIASMLVGVSGASEVFEEGYVTYSNEVKIKNLGVSAETIRKYTVVSGPVAEEMAKGAADRSGAALALSTTGYAGPDDGEGGTTAGTVYIGVYCCGAVKSAHCHFKGDRNEVRRQAAREALRLALEALEERNG